MTKKNHLHKETSAYLLQHAANPVDWYPWGSEALALAREQNKPILLSIGYSACHWCHVMAHESFEDETTANLMNQNFINIKVDREERPDLDKIYQTAHHLLTGRAGGWPLTIFLDPNTHIPFYSGTYFPPQPRMNLPSLSQVLRAVADHYTQQGVQISQQSLALEKALRNIEQQQADAQAQLTTAPLGKARQLLQQNYDSLYGGFGTQPKFVMPSKIEFLLDYWQYLQRHENELDEYALQMALSTLAKLAASGLYDQVGGGFFRYCVDEAWEIPHFEKMLYDNSQMLSLYSRAYALTEHDTFKGILEETADWCLREMQHTNGGFYATLDADSEGKEGAYYIWDKNEVKEALNHDENIMANYFYGLEKAANFEGKWHLQQMYKLPELVQQLNIPLQQGQQLVQQVKNKLFHVRQKRIYPHRDEKIITSWNGLMITGLAKAAWVLDEAKYQQAAVKTLDFTRQHLWDQQRLWAIYAQGQGKLMAYLDDYVFLIDAILHMLQVQWRSQDLNFAITLADSLLAYFYDSEQGGFYFTAKDHESLIQRPKPLVDEVIPSGNGVAVKVLLQLGYLLGESRYLEAANKTLQYSWRGLQDQPQYYSSLLQGVHSSLQPTDIHLVRLQPNDEANWIVPLKQRLSANRLFFKIPAEDDAALPATLQLKSPSSKTIAYVCSGTQCSTVIESAEEWQKLLERK